jgi:drug/metabolite transporter (DMT)-like permease
MMNFDPTIPTGTAIFLGLLAASWWGTWFIALKYLDDYPLDAFYITLFISSMVIVWGAGFILDGSALLQNIQNIWLVDSSRVYVTFICGISYVVGIQISLRVVRVIGLSVTSPIQASINVVTGTFVTALFGGIPENLTVTRIVFAGTFLLAAVLLTMTAGRIRNKAQRDANLDTGLSKDPQVMVRSIFLLLLSSLFIPAYPIAISYGLKSVTQPNGMAVMPFMAILCTGAFVGSILICGSTLTIKKQWHVFLEHGFKKHKLGIFSGLAHYGGNIIHTYATRNLSAVVSWPLGLSGGLWTQFWGLVYGEFKSTPKIGYILLILGFLSYIIGVYIMSSPY